ncbi:MAG: caspase family protein [Methylocystis sp.]|uniref:caspase family protein n=1 Tax=Methylocystis sp. TaxID=1911079 RepID=UPI003DA26BD0
MQLFRTVAVAIVALLALAAGRGADAAERRLALVIGEAAYPARPIATAANDAGLVAQTLQAAGFDVTGARDLEEAALKQAFRDFLDKVNEAGRDAVAFVYVSGYGLQLEGENYILSVDAKIARDADIPLRGLRVSDYLKPLATSAAKLSVVTLDAARASPFKLAGQPLAGGLALYEPGGQTLLAFNAAPGTIAPEASGDYGPYAHALAEMMRDGGRPLMEVFENARLRVSEKTKGAQIPWNSQRVETDFVFFQREAGAPPRKEDLARMSQPISALGPDDGFSAALRRDTLQGYQDYVATYPASPYVKRARAMAAARREALTWRRSRVMDTPEAYWSYLRRYPKGPHAWDARRRLAELRYEFEPPPDFAMVDYGYPPPPPDELVFIDQPVMYFADPIWDFPPPPPPPVYFLPPPPPDFIILPPPIVVTEAYVLPAPPYVPIPVWERPPPYIAPPPANFIFNNVHNAVVVNPEENRVVVRNPTGAVISTEALTAAGAGAAAVAVGATLPNFIARRNPAAAPAGMGQGAVPPPGGPVPAMAPDARPQPGGPAGPGGEHPPAPLPPGAPAKDQALPAPGAGVATQRPMGPHPGARDGAPGGIGAGEPPAGVSGARLPAGLSKEHVLPQGPADGQAMPSQRSAPPPGAPGREAVGHDKRGLPAGLPAGDPALTAPATGAARPGRPERVSPGAASHPQTHEKIQGVDPLGGGMPPPRDGGEPGRLERMQPPSPARADRPARLPPAGMEPGRGPSNPFAGEGRAPGARAVHPPRQPQDIDGGFGGPPGRPRGDMFGEPMGGETRAPARMRPPPMDMPDMRESAPMREMGAPMRGMRRDAAPPRPEPVPGPDAQPFPRHQGAGYPGGVPPQMREAPPPAMREPVMREPAMREPAMDRPPPPSGMAPMRPSGWPQPGAQPRPREEPRRHDGDGGGPPGFGGMR